MIILILTVQRQIFEAARLHQPITGDSVLTSVGWLWSPGARIRSPCNKWHWREFVDLRVISTLEGISSWISKNGQPNLSLSLYINELVQGKIYRKPRFFPCNLGGSCKFPLNQSIEYHKITKPLIPPLQMGPSCYALRRCDNTPTGYLCYIAVRSSNACCQL